MKLAYIKKNFGQEALRIIADADHIIEEHQADKLDLTLRQLYYQFVAKGLLENSQANYNKLGTIISDGRLAGLIDWDAIEDRTRGLRGLHTFRDAAEAMKGVCEGFRIDRWRNQEWRPEVWVEKDALIGVVEPVCDELGVNYFGCRGYNSQSEQWRAGTRFARYIQKGQRPIVFHLGDHDPSGIDMTRDNRERLSLFAGVPIQVVRLGLNMPQIEELRPPPNPAKITDSRAADYIAKYGESSWELDALPPRYLQNLIRENILRLRNEEDWSTSLAMEAEERQALKDARAELGGGNEEEENGPEDTD